MPQYKQTSGFGGGLNLLNRADAIQDNQVTDILNLQVSKDNLVLDNGYVFEDPDVGAETVKLTYTMEDQDGTSQALLFTKNSLYRWVANVWSEVLDSDGYTLDDAVNRGDNVITGHDTKPLIAVTFSGSTNGNGHNMVIWTNGVNRVHKFYYTGADWVCDVMSGLPGINVTAVDFLCIWQDSVWFLSLVEDGIKYAHRIRWCNPGNEEQVDEATWPAAGYYDLLSEHNLIQQAELLSSYLIVYCSESIWRGTWLSTTEQPVIFEQMIDNEGIIGGFSVASVGSYHVFLGRSNIFRYLGGSSIEPFGNLIQDRIYGDGGILNLDYIDYIRAAHIKESDTLWFMFPILDEGAGTAKTYIIRYQIKQGIWTERVVDLLLTSMSLRKVEEDDTWGGDTGKEGTWLEEGPSGEAIGPDRAWVSQVFLTEYPFVFFSCLDAAHVSKLVRYDYILLKDGMTGTYDANGYLDVDYTSGSDVPYRTRSKNFASGSIDARLEHIQITLSGTLGHEVTVKYSIDDGENYSNLGTITIDSYDLKKYKLWGNITFENIMFEFSGAGGGIHIGPLAIAYEAESE
jgi:hypothetical protein